MSSTDGHETICTHDGPCVFMTAVKIAMPDGWATWSLARRREWATGMVTLVVSDQYEDVAKARGEVTTDADRAVFMTKMSATILSTAYDMAALPTDAPLVSVSASGGYQQ
jgi:hypothetical protein